MFILSEKVALITGGASGIGLAISEELLENGLKGIAIADINSTDGKLVADKLQAKYGENRIIFIKLDVSILADFENAFEITVKTFKQLDIVINNAGIVKEPDWVRCVSVNLVGVMNGSMLATEKYLPKFRATDDAIVVNISSIAGLDPMPCIPIYSSTKSGVISLSRALGEGSRYKSTNVRVIAVCPGKTETNIENLDEEIIKEPYLSEMLAINSIEYNQKAEVVASHVINLIKTAPTGSVWLAMNNDCTSLDFTQYIYR